MKAVAVFLVTAATDWLWTRCVSATVLRQEWRAASWGSVLFATSSLLTVSVVDDPWLVLPASAGAFVGTFLAVRQWR